MERQHNAGTSDTEQRLLFGMERDSVVALPFTPDTPETKEFLAISYDYQPHCYQQRRWPQTPAV